MSFSTSRSTSHPGYQHANNIIVHFDGTVSGNDLVDVWAARKGQSGYTASIDSGTPTRQAQKLLTGNTSR